jgi:hypothetical protein
MGAVESALVTVLAFVLLRLLLRRTWISVAAGVLLMSAVSTAQIYGAGTPLVWLFPLVRGALLTFVVVRFGLLPCAVAYYVSSLMTGVPLSLDVWHWSAVPSNLTLALLTGLTMFGFYASRAGQPLFGAVRRV